jgi:hypothetical protein
MPAKKKTVETDITDKWINYSRHIMKHSPYLGIATGGTEDPCIK